MWLQDMHIQFSQDDYLNMDIKSKQIPNQQKWIKVDKFGYMMRLIMMCSLYCIVYNDKMITLYVHCLLVVL
jgi:hypothetical protein